MYSGKWQKWSSESAKKYIDEVHKRAGDKNIQSVFFRWPIVISCRFSYTHAHSRLPLLKEQDCFLPKKNTRKGDGPGPQGLLPLWLGVAIPSPEANNREFKQRRRLQLRQRLEARILLVKRGKIHVLHVQHEFPCNSLPYSTKQQREITKF